MFGVIKIFFHGCWHLVCRFTAYVWGEKAKKGDRMKTGEHHHPN